VRPAPEPPSRFGRLEEEWTARVDTPPFVRKTISDTGAIAVTPFAAISVVVVITTD